MVTVPAETPVTTPLVLTVARLVSLLLQAPPDAVLANVVVAVAHTLTEPAGVIAAGTGLTTTVVLAAAQLPTK